MKIWPPENTRSAGSTGCSLEQPINVMKKADVIEIKPERMAASSLALLTLDTASIVRNCNCARELAVQRPVLRSISALTWASSPLTHDALPVGEVFITSGSQQPCSRGYDSAAMRLWFNSQVTCCGRGALPSS